MQRVTVVIPVFNQPALAAACIASCRAHVDPRHSLLVIDDASTDPATYPALEKALDGMPNARLVLNPQNLGFLRTCNKAVLELDGTDNDVLLLNSDTVVTEGFLEEMLACLYASERHGTCNPRTDAAASCTIVPDCSVDLAPEARHDAWKTLKDLLPRWHVLPTGVGFCLLIRRSLIRRFGLFDEAYGPGYHEETDFCMRIGRYGFSAVSANRAFVFHRGGASFGHERRTELDAAHALLLAERYPESSPAADAYRTAFLPVADHFGEPLGRVHPRRSLLYDLSHLPAAYNGTTEYALRLLEALHPVLSAELDVHILFSEAGDHVFGLSRRYPNVHLRAERIRRKHDIAFTPQQIYTTGHLWLLNALAVRIVSNVQDLIALRVPALCTPELRFAFEMSMRHLDGVVSVSRASLDDLDAFAGERASRMPRAVVHHGVTPPALPLSAPAEDGPFVFVVGNAFSHKAVAEGASRVPPGIRTVTLGGEAATHESGDIPQERIDTLYRTCSAVLFPSQYEGFGLPLLHAAVRGRRIVAWDSATTRELVAAFGLQEHVLTFTSFDEIPALLERAMAETAPVPLDPSVRGWKDAAEETAAFLRRVLDMPADMARLQDRFTELRLLEAKQRESDARHVASEYHRALAMRSLRQRLASFAGRRLAAHPGLKRRISRLCVRLGLLPPPQPTRTSSSA